MIELARSDLPLAARIVTTAPDVATSTNLGGWVSQRGVFGMASRADPLRANQIPSMQRWDVSPRGQHIELGIAENNLFLMLAGTTCSCPGVRPCRLDPSNDARRPTRFPCPRTPLALGLSGSLFGQRLLPVGTLYDPFISRGLDALNYACYQDARFMLVATPSGITLAPEGGAHQSIYTPSIGMGQPNLTYYEPAFGDELAVIMREGFGTAPLFSTLCVGIGLIPGRRSRGRAPTADLMQRPAPLGSSVYLRLSTRPLAQPERTLTPELTQAIIDVRVSV